MAEGPFRGRTGVGEDEPTQPVAPAAAEAKGWSGGVRAVGGLAAVVVGITAVLLIAVVALIIDSQIAATVAGSTSGVVGSIVGAYFGVKVGTDQTKTALQTAQQESATKDRNAAKAQVYALHVAPGDAETVEAAAKRAADAV